MADIKIYSTPNEVNEIAEILEAESIKGSEIEICLDTETTGLNATLEESQGKPVDKLLEFGAIIYINDELHSNIHFYMNPFIKNEYPYPDVSFEVQRIHGINKAFLQNKKALPEDDYLDSMRKLFSVPNTSIVGHNVQFDIGMLREYLRKNNTFFLFKSVIKDTLMIFRKHIDYNTLISLGLLANHKLDNFISYVNKRMNIDFSDIDRTLHGALIDSLLLMRAYKGFNQYVEKTQKFENFIKQYTYLENLVNFKALGYLPFKELKSSILDRNIANIAIQSDNIKGIINSSLEKLNAKRAKNPITIEIINKTIAEIENFIKITHKDKLFDELNERIEKIDKKKSKTPSDVVSIICLMNLKDNLIPNQELYEILDNNLTKLTSKNVYAPVENEDKPLYYVMTDSSLKRGSITLKKVEEEIDNNSTIALVGTMTTPHPYFNKLGKKVDKKVNPIFGATLPLKGSGESIIDLNIFAKNEDGYFELTNSKNGLLSLIHRNSEAEPHLTLENLKGAFSSGNLMLTSGSINGIFETFIKSGEKEKIEQVVSYILKTSGVNKSDFVLEIYDEHNNALNRYINMIAQKLDLKVLWTNPIIHEKGAFFTQKIRNESIFEMKEVYGENYFGTNYEYKTHTNYPLGYDKNLAIDNKIINEYSFHLKPVKPQIPQWGDGNLEHNKEELKTEAWKGLQKRFDGQEIPQLYKDRLERELEIINKMGFASYLLIVSDYVRASKGLGVAVGPGRGSAAGSLACYALEITNIDPIPYNLLFERFLNPERISMPDIDVDFGDIETAWEYMKSKYGQENVYAIITESTLAARSAIDVVCKHYGDDYAQENGFTKYTQLASYLKSTLPNDVGFNLKKYISNEEKLKEDNFKFYCLLQNKKYNDVIKDAIKLEGSVKAFGRHAAGLVIAPKAISKATGFFKDGINTLGSTMKYIEDETGSIKFDFLGLKTLEQIKNTVNLIKEYRNVNINIDKISDEKEVYNSLLEKGTLGLFQIESDGMGGVINGIKPDNFEDIVAILALYRPGPLSSGMVSDFIERKHGRQEVTYPFPELEKILKPTYGTIVYQEQIMQIVQEIGGFSLGGADLVRRAMGKKIKEEMERLKGVFVYGQEENKEEKKEYIAGAKRLGFDETKSNELFDLIVKFADYGFNKSHSAAYAMITYQTMYLKHYFPKEFYIATLNIRSEDMGKISSIIKEATKNGINVLGVDINASKAQFSLENECIRYGLSSIKGVGGIDLEKILTERNNNGEFLSFEDFTNRLPKLDKDTVESLILSGALDLFIEFNSENRNLLLNNFYLSRKEKMIESYGALQLWKNEIEKTGVSLNTKSPFEYDSYLLYATRQDIVPKLDNIPLTDKYESIKVAGFVTEVISKKSGNEKSKWFGKDFAIVNLTDGNQTITAMVPPDVYEKHSNILDEGIVMSFEVSHSEKDGKSSFFVKSCDEKDYNMIKIIPMDDILKKNDFEQFKKLSEQVATVDTNNQVINKDELIFNL